MFLLWRQFGAIFIYSLTHWDQVKDLVNVASGHHWFMGLFSDKPLNESMMTYMYHEKRYGKILFDQITLLIQTLWVLKGHVLEKVVCFVLTSRVSRHCPNWQDWSLAGYWKCIWVRSRNCGCLVTWFCYQLIAKPGKKTATVSWPDPYMQIDR